MAVITVTECFFQLLPVSHGQAWVLSLARTVELEFQQFADQPEGRPGLSQAPGLVTVAVAVSDGDA
jgi:hypothetical protein